MLARYGQQFFIMTNQERIAHNAQAGFTLVYTGDGFEVYKKKNEIGGWTYYSDFIGNEGHYVIWDDCTRGKEELLAIAKDCYGLELK